MEPTREEDGVSGAAGDERAVRVKLENGVWLRRGEARLHMVDFSFDKVCDSCFFGRRRTRLGCPAPSDMRDAATGRKVTCAMRHSAADDELWVAPWAEADPLAEDLAAAVRSRGRGGGES